MKTMGLDHKRIPAILFEAYWTEQSPLPGPASRLPVEGLHDAQFKIPQLWIEIGDFPALAATVVRGHDLGRLIQLQRQREAQSRAVVFILFATLGAAFDWGIIYLT